MDAMHYLPDTDEQDALSEKYWPDEFKAVIRQELQDALSGRLKKSRNLSRLFGRCYSDMYRDFDHFTDAIINILIISAENGADHGFDIVYNAFLTEARVPEQRRYACSYWPHVMTGSVEDKIRRAVVGSYEKDEGFAYAYKDGYTGDFKDYGHFIDEVAGLIVSGIASGIDDRLEQLFKSFLGGYPLAANRRNPKRLKTYL
jgi:hypothetical protein